VFVRKFSFLAQRTTFLAQEFEFLAQEIAFPAQEKQFFVRKNRFLVREKSLRHNLDPGKGRNWLPRCVTIPLDAYAALRYIHRRNAAVLLQSRSMEMEAYL
jgi:hypothetical protein